MQTGEYKKSPLQGLFCMSKGSNFLVILNGQGEVAFISAGNLI